MKVLRPLAEPGRHTCTLDQIEEVPGNFGRPANRFVFATSDGHEIVKTTGQELRKGSSLANFVEELAGGELTPGDEIDLNDYVGEKYVAVVTPGNDGSGSVLAKIAPALAKEEKEGGED